MKDKLYGREIYRLKSPEQITSALYLQVILFRMHERD